MIWTFEQKGRFRIFWEWLALTFFSYIYFSGEFRVFLEGISLKLVAIQPKTEKFITLLSEDHLGKEELVHARFKRKTIVEIAKNLNSIFVLLYLILCVEWSLLREWSESSKQKHKIEGKFRFYRNRNVELINFFPGERPRTK